MTLNETNAVGHVKSILVSSEANKRLLLAVRADEGVDLSSVHIVHLLQGLLNLVLVGLAVHNEHQGVHLLNLLHGALSVEREKKNLVGVSARQVGSALARVFRVARKTEGLRAVERSRGAHLTHTQLTRAALLDNLLGNIRLPRGRNLLVCGEKNVSIHVHSNTKLSVSHVSITALP